MDKSDREDATHSTGTGSAGGGAQPDIDDEVTAAVLQMPDSDVGNNRFIIDNRSPGELTDGDGRADDDALEPGYILRDRFEIVELVHSGGMGRVYKALDNRRHRSASDQVYVAIKMMRRTLTPDFNGRLALEREAVKTQQLAHPNIVNIYDFDQHDEQFFIVMEWLNGASLNALLRRTTGRPIATDFAWRIVEGIAGALQHAHAHHVVHADVNPSNIFITDTQEIKLLDFGVARYVNESETIAGDGIVWATHSYASPQVLSGSPAETEDDLFALACVAYRALTGKHPFAGRSSVEARQEKIIPEPIAGLADSYWRVLKQSLSYERSDRPASADAFFVEQAGADNADSAVAAPRRARIFLVPALLLAAAAVAAGYFWLARNDTGNELPVAAESLPASESPVDVPAAVAEPSALERLLVAAQQAMEDARYLEPKENSAVAMWRDALALEPENATALAGLRQISNVYLQRAESALRGDDPEGAVSAYTVAAETDPDNPALAILRELLLSRANGALANAQVAAGEGDFGRAADWASQAERYALLDASAIDRVRNRIAQFQRERQIREAVAAAEADIAAGRLIAPPTTNAHERLLALQRSYADEPAVLQSIERLVERLLNRAAFATAAEQFPVAAEMLDAAAVFGVLPSDVAAARTWLEQATDLASRPAPSGAASTGTVEAGTEPVNDGTALDVAGDVAAGPIVSPPGERTAESVPVGDDIAESIAADPATSRVQQPLQMSELDIENFVAPRYPPRAMETGLSGAVDLQFNVNPDGSTSNVEVMRAEPGDAFVPSATNAVRQWRFAERDDVVRARVRLRFDPQATE
jgi:TonB family protein